PTRATPEPVDTAAPEAASDEEHVEVTGTGSQGANLRADPGLNGRIVQNVKDGTRLTVIGEDRDAGGRNWRNVRTEGGAAGWVVAEAVRTFDAPTATPGPTETRG